MVVGNGIIQTHPLSRVQQSLTKVEILSIWDRDARFDERALARMDTELVLEYQLTSPRDSTLEWWIPWHEQSQSE